MDEWITMNGAHVLVDDETGELQGTVGNAIRERSSGGENKKSEDGRPKKFNALGQEEATTKITEEVKKAFNTADEKVEKLKQYMLDQYNSNILEEHRIKSFEEMHVGSEPRMHIRNLEYSINHRRNILDDDYPKTSDLVRAQGHLAERVESAKEDLKMIEMEGKYDYPYEYKVAKDTYDILNELSGAVGKIEPESLNGEKYTYNHGGGVSIKYPN